MRRRHASVVDRNRGLGDRRWRRAATADADIATVSMQQAKNRAQHLTTIAVDARSCIISRKYMQIIVEIDR
jgi:hypothetical protein